MKQRMKLLMGVMKLMRVMKTMEVAEDYKMTMATEMKVENTVAKEEITIT